ncbi:aminopeptidase [Neptunitalea sp. Y10]|uniref:Aminopeptidase n=2 Tax=Neptunitalea lumnitzerae TaxID=2965509 RepID=A0ABQ5MHE8_9FLAO|nr:aminopeptidase [Neptunitalea sp. Y10]
MKFLASDDLQGRDVGTEGIAKAASYIEKCFKKHGVKPYFTSYKDTLGNLKELAYNIVGVVPGTDEKLKEEYIVIGAHYDHIGFQDAKNGDEIANGANDNASGTTAVLEFAKYFGKHKSNKRSLLFVLFSAEEKGLLGSEHLAEKFKDENLNVVAMLNFEMIGVPMKKDYITYLTGYDMSNAATVINEEAGTNLAGFLPEAEKYGLFKRSDNFYFYSLLNVPAHTICTFDFTNYEYYHDVADEVSEMDFGHMTNVINAFIPVLDKLANTKEFLIKL